MFEKITDKAILTATKQKFNEGMTAFKATCMFPKDNLPTDFLDTVRKCFSFFTPTALQMKTETYRAIKMNHDLNFPLIDIGTIIYTMQNRPQNDLGMSDKEYDDFLVLTDSLVEQFIDIGKTESERFAAELESAALIELEEQNKFNEAVEKGNEELDTVASHLATGAYI